MHARNDASAAALLQWNSAINSPRRPATRMA